MFLSFCTSLPYQIPILTDTIRFLIGISYILPQPLGFFSCLVISCPSRFRQFNSLHWHLFHGNVLTLLFFVWQYFDGAEGMLPSLNRIFYILLGLEQYWSRILYYWMDPRCSSPCRCLLFTEKSFHIFCWSVVWEKWICIQMLLRQCEGMCTFLCKHLQKQKTENCHKTYLLKQYMKQHMCKQLQRSGGGGNCFVCS